MIRALWCILQFLCFIMYTLFRVAYFLFIFVDVFMLMLHDVCFTSVIRVVTISST